MPRFCWDSFLTVKPVSIRLLNKAFFLDWVEFYSYATRLQQNLNKIDYLKLEILTQSGEIYQQLLSEKQTECAQQLRPVHSLNRRVFVVRRQPSKQNRPFSPYKKLTTYAF